MDLYFNSDSVILSGNMVHISEKTYKEFDLTSFLMQKVFQFLVLFTSFLTKNGVRYFMTFEHYPLIHVEYEYYEHNTKV